MNLPLGGRICYFQNALTPYPDRPIPITSGGERPHLLCFSARYLSMFPLSKTRSGGSNEWSVMAGIFEFGFTCGERERERVGRQGEKA